MNNQNILNLKAKELHSIKNKISGNIKKELITASPYINVKDALKLMSKYDILCLPIQSHSDPEKIVNLVNLFDILIYLVNNVDDFKPIASSNRKILMQEEVLPKICYDRLRENIEQVMTLDNDRESYRLATCNIEDELHDVIKRFSSGIHRAVVLDNQNKPFHIITQMDILRHLFENPGLIPEHININLSLEEIGLAKPRSVTLVQDTTSALEAYRLMATNKYTSIIVVDSFSGKILSNLSASSLRGLSHVNLDNVLHPVQTFMKESPRGIRPLVYGNPKMTFAEALEKMVTINVHHLWLVDKDKKPYSTISPSDILKLFF